MEVGQVNVGDVGEEQGPVPLAAAGALGPIIAIALPDQDHVQDQLDDAQSRVLLSLLMASMPIITLVGLKILADKFSLVSLYLFLTLILLVADGIIVDKMTMLNDGTAIGNEVLMCKLWLALTCVFKLLSLQFAMWLWSDLPDILYLLTYTQPNCMHKSEDDFWQISLCVTIACLFLKVVFKIPKTLAGVLSHSRPVRIHALQVTEVICQLYCESVAIVHWWDYLTSGGENNLLHVMSLAVGLLYMCYKFSKCLRRMQKVIDAFNGDWMCVEYGRAAQPAEMSADHKCAVCLGAPDTPWITGCKHVFCKICLATWVEHEHKMDCPVCRSPIVLDESQWSNGETKVLVLMF